LLHMIYMSIHAYMKVPSEEYTKTVERCIGNEKQECNGEPSL